MRRDEDDRWEPFPTDLLTVADGTQLTGKRLDLPLPDCAVRPSDCADIAVLNTLDGFDVQPRLVGASLFFRIPSLFPCETYRRSSTPCRAARRRSRRPSTSRTVPNPTASALVRVGGLADRATYFRNDLAFETVPGYAVTNLPRVPHQPGRSAGAVRGPETLNYLP